MNEDCFVIVATFGNAWPNQRWAGGIRNIDDAMALLARAIERGFRDAKIWTEKQFTEMLAEKERVRAAASQPDRRGR